jgi:hypothetical protein
MDDAVDVDGDGRALSARRSSRCAETVAMMFSRSVGAGLGRSVRYQGLLKNGKPLGGAGNARALGESRAQNCSGICVRIVVLVILVMSF